jgi:exopolyphosphatase/guanosine-5'-triphosphate,3'-diphosphate pyrophosphatase
VERKKIKLKIPKSWLEQHPLTHADLETEMRHLDDIGYSLELI